MAHPTVEGKIPCALSHHITKTQKNVDKLSLVERQLAFQHWIAYVRTRTPDEPLEQRFTCPLYPCKTSHADFESLLDHVAVCPKLGAAHYWCSECNKEESFPTNSNSPFASRQSALRRMGSKVKGAVLFFKHLSFRGRGSEKSSSIFELDSGSEWKADLPTTGLSTAEFSKGERPKVEPSKAEPPTRQKSQLQGLRQPIETLHELAARCTCVYLHELPTTFTPAGLIDRACNKNSNTWKCEDTSDDSDLISNHDHVRTSIMEPTSPCISPATDQYSPMSSSTHVFSPLSSPTWTQNGHQVESESPKVDISDIPTYDNEISERIAGPALLEPITSSSIRAKPPRTGPQTFCAAVKTLTLQDRIEELHQVLKVLWSEWLQRLSSNADILPAIARLSSDGVLEQSLQVLQDVIVGKPPRSFQHYLTLVLLALACAFVLHGECDVHYWDGLFENMMRWRYMIENLDDRKMFVRFVCQLTIQPQEFRRLCETKDISLTQHHSSCALNLAVPYHQRLNDAIGHAQMSENSTDTPRDLDKILGELKKEAVFTTCLEFLDDVAFAEVLERSVGYSKDASLYVAQHVANIKHMVSSIVWNLSQRLEMNIILSEIIDVHERILNGLLRNPRQVEVTLLSHCMKACWNMPTQKRCRQIISSVCDQPLLGEGPHWHARHHAAELDKIMALFTENREDFSSLSLQTGEETTALTLKPMRTRYESCSTPSTSSDASTHYDGQFVTPVSPSILTENTDYTVFPEEYKVHTSAADTLSASPESQPSSSSQDGKILCPQCPRMFLKSNLSRHISTVHHPRLENIVCREPDCDSTFTRQDNLGKHMRRTHGEVKQIASKRRKLSDAGSLLGHFSTE